ncbi:hypothetical protein K280104A7_19680 [Candidatus Bariatricus faecipullorum]
MLARAGIRRATVIERQCREMSAVSRAGRGKKSPPGRGVAKAGERGMYT